VSKEYLIYGFDAQGGVISSERFFATDHAEVRAIAAEGLNRFAMVEVWEGAAFLLRLRRPAEPPPGGGVEAPGAAPVPRGDERRIEPRFATNTPARLFYGAGYIRWMDCIIKDRSERGAKIQAPEIFQLSRKLVLLDYLAGEAFLAQPRWRKRDLAGLWLEVRYDMRELTDPALARVREAWLALGPALNGSGSAGR
jgi:hypothetical protein